MKKMKLDLDCLKFKKQCYSINKILMQNNYSYRFFELKNKFHQLINENPSKKTIILCNRKNKLFSNCSNGI